MPITIQDADMAGFIESVEIILKEATDAVRALDAGKTADARYELGKITGQLSTFKGALQAHQISGQKPKPSIGPRS